MLEIPESKVMNLQVDATLAGKRIVKVIITITVFKKQTRCER